MKQPILYSILGILTAGSILGEFFMHGKYHAEFGFWHHTAGSYALLGLIGTLGLVCIAKALAATGLEKSDSHHD